MNIMDYADLYAERAHRGQVRKYNGTPYIEHPRRVALKLKELNDSRPPDGTYFTEDHIAVAYLHDVIEDCGVSYEQLGWDFGSDIALRVKDLTQTPKADLPNTNRAQRKAIDRSLLASRDTIIQSIKLADRIDNLREMEGCDPEFYEVYMDESRLLLDALTKADPRLREELASLLA